MGSSTILGKLTSLIALQRGLPSLLGLPDDILWEEVKMVRSHPFILIVIAFLVWAYFGFPSPNTLMNWPSAGQDCLKFAEEHKPQLFSGSDGKTRSANSWLKNGKIVVEVGAFREDETYCVIGDGTIQIVSIPKSNAWR
jgi:hypothetical protein